MQKAKQIMERGMVEENYTCDEVMHSFFQAAYYIGKEIICFSKFVGLCFLLVKVKANITEKLHHDEKSCGKILFCISSLVQNFILFLMGSLIVDSLVL